jgi:dihydrofolate reductase
MPDEETFAYFTQLTRDADTFLYGRKTYELMVPYWPDAAKEDPSDEFAQAFDAVKKIVVFSQSLDAARDEKTSIVSMDIRNEVLKLKQEQGKNILTGGIILPAQLAALGLIDEYHLLMHPIVIGEGRRLFEGINLQEKLQLKLVESTVFKSGTVALRFSKE